jgi:tetratricopeptide (TPR) repeat protein
MKKLLLLTLFLITFQHLVFAETAKEYFDRGMVYAQQGNYARTVSDCDKAVGLYPKSGMVYSSLGFAYMKKGHYELAWNDVRRAEELGYKVPATVLEHLKKDSGKEK